MVGRQLPFFSLHRAVLADLGVRRLPRHAGDLAGDPGRRRSASRCRSSWCRTITARGWSTSIAAICSMACLALFLQGLAAEASVWTERAARRRDDRRRRRDAPGDAQAPTAGGARPSVMQAWMPWVDPDRARLRVGPAAGRRTRSTASSAPQVPDRRACTSWSMRMPPVVPKPTHGSARSTRSTAVGDRHRHPARGDRSPALVHGLLDPLSSSRTYWRHARGWCAIRC